SVALKERDALEVDREGGGREVVKVVVRDDQEQERQGGGVRDRRFGNHDVLPDRAVERGVAIESAAYVPPRVPDRRPVVRAVIATADRVLAIAWSPLCRCPAERTDRGGPSLGRGRPAGADAAARVAGRSTEAPIRHPLDRGGGDRGCCDRRQRACTGPDGDSWNANSHSPLP